MPDKTICVVDDDSSVRRAVARLLRSYSLSVETYCSAEAFLDSSPPNGVACLILDVHMGGMSGLDLSDQLRGAGSFAPPIIFITAHDDAATRDRVDRSEAIAYIRKPFETTTLLAAISRAIDRDLEPPPA